MDEETVHEHRNDVRYDTDTRTESRLTRRGFWLSPSRIISFIIGVFLVVVGAFAIGRAGLDDSLNRPLVDVMGITQSTSVGLMELGAGLLLIGCAASEALRGLIGIIGALGLLAGIAGLAASAEIQDNIGFARDTAWLFVIWGAAALVAAFLPSFYESRRTVGEPGVVRS
jgi:hypothetical protein